MLLLYFLLWTAVAANKEPLYGKIGNEAVLTSADSVVNPITSIEWKHGPDLAMEWYGDETFSYRHFKVRGSLNTSTGALTIRGLTPDDSGNYTVEINNKVTNKTELLVISPVSKPTLSLWCEPEMTYCVLTCNGNTTDAEPVTYWWTSGDTTLSSTKEQKITKENNELWFSCAFKNPVSSSSSEIVFNPFKEKEPLCGKIGDKAVLTADSVVKPITSILWKHGADLAMEWYGGETTAYRHFKARGSLDTSNGALTITGLTPDDSGSYTVEINNKVTSKTQLLVISPVSKPTLSLWCEPEMTHCVLTCNGDTTGAEPVTYWWTSGDTKWSSTKEHKITMEDKEPWFSCVFENPVSFNSSEKVSNPFKESDQTRMYISIPVFGVFLVVCIILIYKCKKGQADEKTRQEREELLPIQDTSTQDQTSVVTQDTHNGTASLVVVQETSNQDTTSTVPPETSKETERSTTSPDVPETSTQDQTSVVTQDTSNGTERSTTSPDVPETSTQDQENPKIPVMKLRGQQQVQMSLKHPLRTRKVLSHQIPAMKLRSHQ